MRCEMDQEQYELLVDTAARVKVLEEFMAEMTSYLKEKDPEACKVIADAVARRASGGA